MHWVPLGLPSATPMTQVLRLSFEYYYYCANRCFTRVSVGCESAVC